MDVGNNIRFFRLNAGLTLNELAGLLGTTKSTVSKYELGRRQLNPDQLERIAAALGVPVLWLLTGPPSGDKERSPQITMDDFTYAMQNEAKELTEEDKQILLSMAKHLNEARKQAENK